ncbi:uncharacterized protein LOC128867010 [Anastrepha ludens]|uniref:uncharacterized protein LOC128867010 n=1 Tax=Anastrepha ludens TaxID=28586 RepID=UPI0023B1F6BB|nr:uncharacterized protein LOC128867010 [Anastrepha ludens]
MHFFNIASLLLMTAVTSEARFEDFVIKDKNDLKRFGDFDDTSDEYYEADEDSMLSLESLRRLSHEEPDIMNRLMDISLDLLPPDLLPKFQQCYAQREFSTCLEDDDNSLQLVEVLNMLRRNIYDFL